jgi:hypothetical protein
MAEMDKDLIDVDQYVAEGSHVAEEVAVGASQTGKSSP